MFILVKKCCFIFFFCFTVFFTVGTLYEIQESESDDENKISEEHMDAWIEDNTDFFDCLDQV
jgi:hypothetical protein